MTKKLIVAACAVLALSLSNLHAQNAPGPKGKGQGGPAINQECPRPDCPVGGQGVGHAVRPREQNPRHGFAPEGAASFRGRESNEAQSLVNVAREPCPWMTTAQPWAWAKALMASVVSGSPGEPAQ